MKTKKKQAVLLFSLVFAFTALFGSTLVNASTPSSGDFNYEVTTEGTINITGYKGSGGDVSIPATIDSKPVTSIGDGAFKNTGVTNVTFPNSLVTIGKTAFQGNALTDVSFPASLTTIDIAAFEKNNISNIFFAGSGTAVKERAFYDNALVQPPLQGLSEIGFLAFAENKLDRISFPSNAVVWGSNPFGQNPTVVSITFASDMSVAQELVDVENNWDTEHTVWFLDEEKTQEAHFPLNVTSGMSIYRSLGNATYTVSTYVQQADGNYPASATATETKSGEIGTTVTETPDPAKILDTDKSVLSGEIDASGSLVLSIYYKSGSQVIYDPNGGLGSMANSTGADGETITLTKNAYYQSEFIFTGWNTKKDNSGTAYADEASFTLTDPSTTLYAQWDWFAMDKATRITAQGPSDVFADYTTMGVKTVTDAVVPGYKVDAYDIHFNGEAGEAVQPNSELEITIPLNKLKEEGIAVFHFTDKNTFEKVPCKVASKNGEKVVVFKAKSFSTYAVGNPAAGTVTPTSSVNTGDLGTPAGIFALLSLLLLIGLYGRKKIKG